MKLAHASLPALFTFGPLFMVNMGMGCNHENWVERITWIHFFTRMAGVFMVAAAVGILMRITQRQGEAVELLRKELDALKAGKT